MSWIPPLLVAIPLLSAAVVAGLDHLTPKPVKDALVVAASLATTALAFLLLWHAENHEAPPSASTSRSGRLPPGCAASSGSSSPLPLSTG
jgi:formate hydrogenlyase subunit 3/multisubunit Na+/H+ antiporter MnhD subunit